MGPTNSIQETASLPPVVQQGPTGENSNDLKKALGTFAIMASAVAAEYGTGVNT
jgi:hypothetical protein